MDYLRTSVKWPDLLQEANMEKYLTTTQFAARAGVSVELVHKWCRDERIKFMRAGDGDNAFYLIPESELENTPKPTSKRGRPRGWRKSNDQK